MGAKKKTTSKIEQPVPASRETSMSDLGFTITGALEIDFPEGMRKHCDPAPAVILVDEKQPDEDSSTVDSPMEKVNPFEEKKPRIFAITRAENEGKTVTKNVVGLQVKNWHFRAEDAKILSHCLDKHEKLESVQFVRTKLTKSALAQLSLPQSVKFLSIHSNDMTEPGFIDALLHKGVPHIGLQYNSMGLEECSEIASALRNNETISTLNLSGNRIGDEGARLIARSLLVNKKLAALSLQNCGLGDRAAIDFSRVLSRQTEMTQEEIIRWRKIRMEIIVASNSSLQLTIKPTKQNRPGSENSGSQTGKESAGKQRKTKTEKADTGKGGKGAKPKRASNSNIAEPKSASPKLPDPQIPDETGIVRQDGKMFAPGNKSLYSLNLSSNRIGKEGMLSLLMMLDSHCEAEIKNEVSSTSLLHLKLDNNIHNNLQFVSAMRDNQKYAEIVTGIDGLFATCKTSIPRLDDIKEDN